MQAHEQVEFIKAIGEFVIDQTKKATAPLVARIEQLEKFIGDMPVPINGNDGIDGKDGAPGKDFNPDEFLDFVKRSVADEVCLAVKLLPTPKDGAPGADGKDGANVDMDQVADVIQNSVAQYVMNALAEWPKPLDGKDGAPGKDGRDGTDGTDGKSVSADDLLPVIADAVAKAVAGLPVVRHVVGGFIDRDGALHHTYNDGQNIRLGVVVGADGAAGIDGKDGATPEQIAALVKAAIEEIPKPKDGKDGRDGLGFKDLNVVLENGRELVFTFTLDDHSKEFRLTVPFVLYQNVWRAAEKYRQGDSVTRDGSTFIALKDTDTMPGSKGSDWQLSCKRGQNGSQGERGAPGKDGAPGRDGRDLTQLGPDGKKW